MNYKGFVKYREPVERIQADTERLCAEGVSRAQIAVCENCAEVVAGLCEGDRLVVCSLSEISPGVFDLLRLLEEIASRGAVLRSIDEPWLDMERGDCDWTALMHGLLEFASTTVSERVKAVLSQRKAAGKQLGRPRGFSPERLKRYRKAAELYQHSEMSVREICTEVGIETRSLYRYISASDIAFTRRKGTGTATLTDTGEPGQ